MKNIRTKSKEIVDYWFKIVDESGLSVDASEANERCWRCGYKTPLERCHIIPSSLGGPDTADNLVLLCRRCHIENPNVNDPKIMWDWIRAYGTPFYDTFWTLESYKEYEFIYGKSFEEELKERTIEDIAKFKEIYVQKQKGVSYHYGHPHLNKATLAGVLRMTLEEYDRLSSLEKSQ